MIGVFLIVAALHCRFPLAVWIVGGSAIVAAMALVILGQKRLDSLIAWWLGRQGLIRTSAVFALAFGVLLVYAGA